LTDPDYKPQEQSNKQREQQSYKGFIEGLPQINEQMPGLCKLKDPGKHKIWTWEDQ